MKSSEWWKRNKCSWNINKKRRQHASVFFWSLNCDNMIAVLRPAFRKNTGIIQSVQSAHTHQYIRVVPVPKRTVRFKANQHPLVIRVIRSLTRSHLKNCKLYLVLVHSTRCLILHCDRFETIQVVFKYMTIINLNTVDKRTVDTLVDVLISKR